MSLIKSAILEEIVYARLDGGTDLLRSIEDICKQRHIQTGVILTCTGALSKARLQRFVHKLPADTATQNTVQPCELIGPLEATAQGLIGELHAPTLGGKPFGGGGVSWRHGGVYVHVHMVVTTPEETVCGHLLEGCIVRSPSHFILAIARTKGVLLRMVYDEQGNHNDLVSCNI